MKLSFLSIVMHETSSALGMMSISARIHRPTCVMRP